MTVGEWVTYREPADAPRGSGQYPITPGAFVRAQVVRVVDDNTADLVVYDGNNQIVHGVVEARREPNGLWS